VIGQSDAEVGTVAAYRTADGSPVGRLQTPRAHGLALSADGSSGVTVNQLAAFDFASGVVRKLGKSLGPIRATADGRYALFHGGDDTPFHLCVLELATGRVVKQFAGPSLTEHFRPLSDGSLQITGQELRARTDDRDEEVGLRFDPATLELTELWRSPHGSPWGRAIDFDPQRGLGVTTSWVLETRVIDLKTGETVLTIRNGTFGDYGVYRWLDLVFWIFVAISPALLGGYWWLRRFRRRRATARSGP
jgi:hypothetical protein